MLIDVVKFLEALEDEGADVCEDCYDYFIFGFSRETISAVINNRVNQEMSAREYEQILRRMEKTQPMPEELYLHGKAINHYEIDKAISIVAQWAEEHPEKKRKTYIEDFFEKFPNCVRRCEDGMPPACRDLIYGTRNKECSNEPNCCGTCWNAEMEGEK